MAKRRARTDPTEKTDWDFLAAMPTKVLQMIAQKLRYPYVTGMRMTCKRISHAVGGIPAPLNFADLSGIELTNLARKFNLWCCAGCGFVLHRSKFDLPMGKNGLRSRDMTKRGRVVHRMRRRFCMDCEHDVPAAEARVVSRRGREVVGGVVCRDYLKHVYKEAAKEAAAEAVRFFSR